MPHTAPKIHNGALTAMDGLPDADRQRLLVAVERLQDTDPADWPADDVVRLPDPNPLYLLRLAPDYRVILGRTTTNELEIRDIFRAEALRFWLHQEGRNGSPREGKVSREGQVSGTCQEPLVLFCEGKRFLYT